MRSRDILGKFLHFIVDNTLMFTVAIMCMVHVVLLMIVWYAGVMPLTLFNSMSVIIYLVCIFLCKHDHIMPVYMSIILEVSIYSTVAVYYIGWKSGSYNFLFSIVPIIIYFGSYLFKGIRRWMIVLVLALIFALYALLYTAYSNINPVYEMAGTVRTIMMLFSSFVMYFSVVFYSSIYIISSEIEKMGLELTNEQLSADASEDALTGLLNRRGFIPRIESLMKSDQPKQFCVAFCDIDNFKGINDTYGHDCGDEVLRHTTALIKNEMSDCDICRWGGEEIVILMKDYDFVSARQKIEDLRKLVEKTPTVFFNKRIKVTITIGLTKYMENFSKAEDLIKIADERMYYGKQHGKNVLVSED
ncbi:diguanylate cyclase (GGDEF) domain-containing protein [Oribacterium sp. KHPX15]|nr:diguanylate cyclase (GGDEF) domain-containing protein [Oribacterium sp. KHPX15]